MLNYLFLALAVVGISLQLVFTKLYQKRAGSGVRFTLLFNTVSALFSLLLFLCLSGFSLKFTGFSLLMAALLAVIFSANGLLAIKICSMGNVAVYTLFLMLGGMTLPFVYGVSCLHEKISAFRCIALALLVAALVFQSLDSGLGRDKGRTKIVFYLCCALIFLSNGAASVVSKMHQDPSWLKSLGLPADPVDTNPFLVLTYFFMFLLNGAALGVYLLKGNAAGRAKSAGAPQGLSSDAARERTRPALKAVVIILLQAVFSSLGYLMQLLGARELDASLLYPIVTGGTIVLGSIAGFIFFRERIRGYGIASVALAFVSTVLFAF